MTPEIIDAANELAQLHVDQAVASMSINRTAVSATHCEECGESIPDPRRIAVPGCRMCASCKADAEERGKHQR